jgi:hypothetical protein
VLLLNGVVLVKGVIDHSKTTLGGFAQKSYINNNRRRQNVLAVSNVLSAYLCDAALRFIGFTAVITAEARRTAEKTFEQSYFR